METNILFAVGLNLRQSRLKSKVQTTYTIVMVDNASIHTSKKFRARIDDWILENKLFVCFLPTYSPELNLIEILWRKVKYEWLNLLSITDFKMFEKELERVFSSFGHEYMISFS